MNQGTSSGRVLVIAGSDSGGGAGIQADTKAITCMGAYAATAITALTAQNTLGVHGVHPVPVDFLRLQIRTVLDDIGADSLKTGMLHDAVTVEAVAGELAPWTNRCPLVVDPVMVAQSGARLLDTDALDALWQHLIPQATLLTPNLPEAAALLGRPVESGPDMPEAARRLAERAGTAVLLKGGHLPGDALQDVLASAQGVEVFEHQRLPTRHTHGSGCTLASAIAAALAQGNDLRTAVERGRNYLLEAIRSTRPLGRGAGPVNHGWTVDPERC
ncbi:bifunctional hydroxymethylpyrimidine kinase/phosphomethylpyrimidine kinase [Methylonatrum kenyense]|uniref:bifunctional hydroxymethylpyrimidine kinase/phosphomethylpyrimidine kinase n=1 Tax=Methylonatrum kenyense TaxID=455253 RepID=UPI0020C0A294|nr:bifunctional hydroxymethylpyrimidine kinase/phosphomethylpyrimidine kinase [Methylonatrum kenyense]MCK8516436.1 bifunctional hydroxymethylpyrimidine kinase/phosphomethylpyrimidine kinase [Methylonatrum kenyense]